MCGRPGKEEQHEGPHNGSNESVSQIGISSPPSAPLTLSLTAFLCSESEEMEMEAAAAAKKKNLLAARKSAA